MTDPRTKRLSRLERVHRFLHSQNSVHSAVLESLVDKVISAGALLVVGDRSDTGEFKKIGAILTIVFIGVALLRGEGALWRLISRWEAPKPGAKPEPAPDAPEEPVERLDLAEDEM